MTAHITVGEENAAEVVMRVSAQGPWYADVVMEGDPDLSGQVTIRLGELELVGTIDPQHNGTRGLQRMLRVIAGGNGWMTLLGPKAYHNDAGVDASQIAIDAATEAGETLGNFTLDQPTLGVDYVRQSGPASRVLEDAIGAQRWWVDYDGVTQIGARAEVTPDTGSYTVLDEVPDARVVTLHVEDLRSVVVGSVLTEGLDEQRVVAELVITAKPDELTVQAWCAGEGAYSRIASLLRGISRRAVDDRLFGVYKYRVVDSVGDRLRLQAVNPDEGLPNLSPIPMWPGLAGSHPELKGSSEVLVQFIGGKRSEPVVTHYARKVDDSNIWVPTTLTLNASNELVLASTIVRLGSAGATEQGVKGNSQQSTLNDLLNALSAWAALVKTGITAGGGTLDNTAFSAAISAAQTGLSNALSSEVYLE